MLWIWSISGHLLVIRIVNHVSIIKQILLSTLSTTIPAATPCFSAITFSLKSKVKYNFSKIETKMLYLDVDIILVWPTSPIHTTAKWWIGCIWIPFASSMCSWWICWSGICWCCCWCTFTPVFYGMAVEITTVSIMELKPNLNSRFIRFCNFYLWIVLRKDSSALVNCFLVRARISLTTSFPIVITNTTHISIVLFVTCPWGGATEIFGRWVWISDTGIIIIGDITNIIQIPKLYPVNPHFSFRIKEFIPRIWSIKKPTANSNIQDKIKWLIKRLSLF